MNKTDPLGLRPCDDTFGASTAMLGGGGGVYFSAVLPLVDVCLAGAGRQCTLHESGVVTTNCPGDNPWLFPDPFFLLDKFFEWLSDGGPDVLGILQKKYLANDAPDKYPLVFRVYGGIATRNGGSWTPVNPVEVEYFFGPGSYRDLAGLPDPPDNTGEYMIAGVITNSAAVVAMYPADSYTGPSGKKRSGGLPEWIIPGGCSNPLLTCAAQPYTLSPPL